MLVLSSHLSDIRSAISSHRCLAAAKNARNLFVLTGLISFLSWLLQFHFSREQEQARRKLSDVYIILQNEIVGILLYNRSSIIEPREISWSTIMW
jgi:hypothetical protein